jgi:hypothetical protein
VREFRQAESALIALFIGGDPERRFDSMWTQSHNDYLDALTNLRLDLKRMK